MILSLLKHLNYKLLFFGYTLDRSLFLENLMNFMKLFDNDWYKLPVDIVILYPVVESKVVIWSL